MKPHMLAGPSRKRSLPDTHGEIVPRKRTSLSREPRAPQEQKNESFRTPEPPHTNNLTQECFRDNHVDVATTAVPSKRRCFMCLRVRLHEHEQCHTRPTTDPSISRITVFGRTETAHDGVP